MMAGVVAMASVIEDFDTQPCKKSHKDGGNPVVKTITNYFSPLPKPVEKFSSPPRSNNIMDYFIRRASSSKEKTSSPEQLKGKCPTFQLDAEKHTSPEAAVKRPSQKRRRKASKAASKHVEAETVRPADEESCFIVEEPRDDRDSTAEAVGNCGVLGSDTAALLVHLSAEACITERTSDEYASKTVSEKDEHHEDDSRCENNVKLQPELNSIELSPILPSKNKPKQVKTVTRNSRKKQQQQKAKCSEPDEEKTETSLCDISMEVNVDESSELNNSTVTISFEEFVRSQSEDRDEENIEDVSKITLDAEEIHTDLLSTPKTEENIGSEKPPLQVSPRTVTFQAEVHVVSPKPEAKVVGKVASIFNRRKAGISPAEVESSLAEAAQQLPSTSLTVKRKSNVVIQEEDLELAVLESEFTAKCSEAERKQFMAAFKQASVNGSKTRLSKSQGNQKQPGEKVLDDVDKDDEGSSVTPTSTEQIADASTDNKVATKKLTRKSLREDEEQKEAALAPPVAALVEETEATAVEIHDERKEPPITSTPSIPTVRRSKRGTAARQAPEAVSAAPIRKTRKPNESKDAAVTSINDSPAEMSAPKTRKSKHGVFVAEMVCPPDTRQSPIRIKFTRVHKNVPRTKAESGSVTNASLATKMTNDSKKRKRAKKLVEKARIIQQSKKAALKEKGTLRCSSRAEACTKKNYCEDEDSVICLEEDQPASLLTAPAKRKTQRSLRSLNDVLGKATPVGKETKPVSGSKVALLAQEKAARKVSEVISIFDDGSSEGSENSQSDEQFRARREFLKSGLPESFRKQMAKTAATKEAYSLSCSSFQPVIHVKQTPKDCPLWSLLWPESSLLSHLKELWSQTSNPLPSVRGPFHVKTEPARRAFNERGSGWRPEMPESVRQLLTEEVITSNPQFPVQMFITHFLKRRADHQRQCTATEPEAPTRLTGATLSADSAVGKRKRMEEEGEMPVKVAKKQRANSSGEKLSTAEPEPTKRGGRTRRGQRSRSAEEGRDEPMPSVKAAPIPPEDEAVVAGRNDEVKEDMLWTDKYQPQHSNDIIGNTASVKRLHSWLKEWKLRADREESKKQKEKKQGEDSSDTDWNCGEEDSQDGEDMLCNTMLITGPTGVGKTAAVYACAQELGFKVFEVNASSQRSGRLILSQLKEATQSHQVDSQGVNAHKPAYFNSYGTSSSAGSLRPGSSPRKINSPGRVASPRKHPQSPRAAKRGGLAPTSLANFFKIGRPTNKETPNAKKIEQAAESKNVSKATECGSKHKHPAVKSPTAATAGAKSDEEQSKKTATSLILFEEVDVIFADDSGFLAAIKTFMTTTKRPVILTTSDPAFSTMFDGNFEEIHFKAPSLSDAGCFLRLLCLAEDMRIDHRDVSSLLRLNGCDMRQSLLQLQFWARSGGGRCATQPFPHTGKNAEVKPETEEVACMSVSDGTSALPPCETRCTESMLGLLNIEPERDILELLGNHSPMEEALCWKLLTKSRQRGMNLLYSNMETLLPLPLSPLTSSTRKLQRCVSVSQDQQPVNPKELPSHACLPQAAESAGCTDDGSAVKLPNRVRKTKRRRCLPDHNGLQSDSDSEDGFLSLREPQGLPQTKEEVKESLPPETVKRKPLTPEERLKSLPVSQCLESIAEFLDNVSYMDTSLPARSDGGDGLGGMRPVVKDGMTDEMRVETDRGNWVRGEHSLEIQAAVEALSFHKCRAAVAEAWDKAQQLEVELAKESAAELSLPVAAQRDGYSLTHDGPCEPQLVELRSEVMKSLMSRGVFGTLGNRPAAALDYMPALRAICRSEQLKEQGKVKRRFLHYLDAIHLGLEKSTLQHLAEDFP
uniref:Atad5a n=1 Tax=Cryptopsaras couesii TaxID=412659 RepID=A0AA49JEI2_CRYCE|nr:Atad5a [Cryptopsaras couesii]